MQLIADKNKYAHKEELYVKVRDAEGRIIADEVVRRLPAVNTDHPYYSEWKIRSENLNDLLDHLSKKGQNLNILDLGCGNGWMSKRLNESGHSVTAADLNLVELEQAERVFDSSVRLQWVYANIMADDIPNAPFDVIVLAASCQYFSDISSLKERLLLLLKENGEIHLFDSIFYTPANQQQARQRSKDYYASLGFPQMAEYYFHHSIDDLHKAGFKKKEKPFLKRLFNKSILSWYIFTKR